MLGTGCRIGEVLGLRWQDIDFKNRTININHNLVYRAQDDGTCINRVNSPKTSAGIRIIPMLDEMFDAFLEEYQYQKVIGFSTDEIDGYSGFVFCTGEGKVYLPGMINRTIHTICADYNKEEAAKADAEDGLLFRLAYCTRVYCSERYPMAKADWSYVTNDGDIYLNPHRKASVGEWEYIISHCLLHLGFGHAQSIAEGILNAPVSGIAAQRHIILRPAQTSLRSTSLPQAHHSETALCSFSTPACSRRLRSSAPTTQLTTILARSSAMKGYTHTDSA